MQDSPFRRYVYTAFQRHAAKSDQKVSSLFPEITFTHEPGTNVLRVSGSSEALDRVTAWVGSAVPEVA